MSAEKALVAVLQVALKRIPDVLSSPEQAKRVLREVCILRRLKHPFLINLRDAFTQPSTCGKSLCSSQPCLLGQVACLHMQQAPVSLTGGLVCWDTHHASLE